MNRIIKSISFAFISQDIDVYFPDDSDHNCIIINRLVCSNCGEYWHTSLNECYFCGEINYYLYSCTSCNKKYSITKSKIKCECNDQNSRLIKACLNPDCLSNSDEKIKEICISAGGVFDLDSPFSISKTYCINCGSIKNNYKTYRLYIWNRTNNNETINHFINNHQNIKKGDIILSKKRFSDYLKYGYTIYNPEKVSEIDYQYNSIKDIVKELFPVKIDFSNVLKSIKSLKYL